MNIGETVSPGGGRVQNSDMGFLRVGSAILLAAAAAVTPSAAPANAEEPVLHQVTYSVFTEKPFPGATIYYRDTEPPSYADYSHNPYEFSPKISADLGPEQPWVLNVQLANPDQWAMVIGTSVSSRNPPNFHCVLAVDGVVVVTKAGAKGALCSIRNW